MIAFLYLICFVQAESTTNSTTSRFTSTPVYADPWGRPTHARVVIEPPQTVEDLYSTKRRFRFWWDDIGVTATIEIQGRLRWRTLATDVPLGWISDELPRGSVFRIRLEGGARTSDPLSTPRYYSPTDIARSSGTAPLLSNIILDMDTGTKLWGAGYTGGLIEVSDSDSVNTWTRWDGLPDDRVLSVSVDDEVTWVGTTNGLAKIYDGKVLQIWNDALADSYVQSLDAKDGIVYIGTYQGLDRLINATDQPRIEHLLPQWSVFSLLTDGKRTAVGYEGITFISDQDNISSQDWPGNIEALAQIDDALWMATETKGLVKSTSEGTTILLDEQIYDILPREEDVWIAGQGHIWSISKTHPHTVTGKVVGLGPMNTLAEFDNHIWYGANGLHSLNLSLPWEDPNLSQVIKHTPLITHASMNDLLPLETGLYFSDSISAAPQTIGTVQKTTPLAMDVAQIQFTAAQFHHSPSKKQLWMWNTTLTKQYTDGVEERHNLEHPIIDMADWLGQTWFVDEVGLYKWQDNGDHSLEYELPEIQELSSNGATLWIRTIDSIHHVTPSTVTEYATPSPVTAVAPSGLTVCVGTEDGLFRFWKGREDMWENPLGMQDQNVKIIDTIGDDKGGCWIAGEDGSIGLIDIDGGSTWWHLPEPDPPTIHKLILERNQVWVLTEEGAWLLW